MKNQLLVALFSLFSASIAFTDPKSKPPEKIGIAIIDVKNIQPQIPADIIEAIKDSNRNDEVIAWVQKPENKNAVDKEKRSPLMLAIMNDQIALAYQLIFDEKVDTSGSDIDGRTALDYAIAYGPNIPLSMQPQNLDIINKTVVDSIKSYVPGRTKLLEPIIKELTERKPLWQKKSLENLQELKALGQTIGKMLKSGEAYEGTAEKPPQEIIDLIAEFNAVSTQFIVDYIAMLKRYGIE